MLSNVFLKNIRDQRKSFLWWSIGISALVIITMLFYPSFSETPELDEIFKDMPETITAMFVGEFSEMTTPEGFLNSQLFFVLYPLLFLFFGIARGSSSISGEEEKGTLDLLMSYPIKRSMLVTQKFAAMVITILMLAIVLWLDVAIGVIATDMDISLWRVWEATLNCALLGVTFGTLALALSCAKSSRGLSAGLTSALGIGSYFLNALAPAVEPIEPFQRLSLFYYYIGADPVTNGLNLGHASVLVMITLASITTALITFERRDLVT